MTTIISTHPVNMRYVKWERNSQSHTKTALYDYTILGGSGVVNRKTLITPIGVATEVNDEDIEKLMAIPAFVTDVKNGLIKILKRTKKSSIDADDEALKDMDVDGLGKPITSEQLEEAGAEIKEDGSIDISKGGKNVQAIRNQIILDNENKSKHRGRNKDRNKKA